MESSEEIDLGLDSLGDTAHIEEEIPLIGDSVDELLPDKKIFREAESVEDLVEQIAAFAGWQEEEHPRHGGGSPQGGEFAPKGEGGKTGGKPGAGKTGKQLEGLAAQTADKKQITLDEADSLLRKQVGIGLDQFTDGFISDGYTTNFTRIQITDKRITVAGAIMADNGQQIVGTFIRDLYPSEGTAYHDSFSIKPEFQGAGIAKSFLKNSVKVYDQMGLKNIEMLADGDVGKYAWALYGFDFSTKADLDAMKRKLKIFVTAGVVNKKLKAQVDNINHAWEVAALVDGNTKIGKDFLLHRWGYWHGKLELAKDSSSRKIFDHYVNS